MATTPVSTFSRISRTSALRISIPAVAPRPVPTITDMGVASPSAQGQAMIRTETAARRPWAIRGSGPTSAQVTKAATAIATTAGTNQAATMSATRWMGARLRWASPTSLTIRARSVSAPTRSARITREPVPFTVPPTRPAPGVFSTGIGSPLTMDSSTALAPSRTIPSTGTRSPGRTRRRSPSFTSDVGISFSLPSPATSLEVSGASSRRERRALLVRLRARSSSTWPRRTRTVITAAASK